jgi:serine/threonine protein kinase
MGNLLTCLRWWTNYRNNSKVKLEMSVTPSARRTRQRPRLVLNTDNHTPLDYSFPNVTDVTTDITTQFPSEWKPIGTGSRSVVYQTNHVLTGNRVAIKRIEVPCLGDNILTKTQRTQMCRQLETEINCLRSLCHPQIIHLHSVSRDHRYLYLVTEVSRGRDLFHQLKQHGPLPETTVHHIIGDILRGIQYCHAQGVTHRDLKLENILVMTDSLDGPVKICDFGVSTNRKPPYHTLVGTTGYVAPEVSQGCYDQACDLWALGVIMYTLFTGELPFVSEDSIELRRLTAAAKWDRSRPIWKKISHPAIHLLQHLLVADPENRYTATQALESTWLATAPTSPP